MPRLALMVASLLAVATGCKMKDNLLFCSNPNNASSDDCRIDGGAKSCKTSNDCISTQSMPACDTTAMRCVQCTADDHNLCGDTTPVCLNDSCAACTTDDQCGTGGLCLPTGACAASSNIIHATANGSTSGSCGDSQANGCSLPTALTLVSGTRNVIKLDDHGMPNMYMDPAGFTVNTNVTIDGRGGAVLHRSGDGPIVTIAGGKTATIYGGTMHDATGDFGDSILCSSGATLTVDGTTFDMSDKSAINAMATSRLTVTNVVIRNSGQRNNPFVAGIIAGGASITLSRSQVLSGQGNGLSVTAGTFTVVGNVFMNNGNSGNPNSGVTISTQFASTNRFDFNTLVRSTAQNNLIGGITCAAGTDALGAPFVGYDNIIWNNTGPSEIAGNCLHSYSDIGPGAVVPGEGNTNGNPNLMNEMSDPHLQPGSPAIRGAKPTADLSGLAAKDIDGQPRIAPADIGADQALR